jgi:hypothetical protein
VIPHEVYDALVPIGALVTTVTGLYFRDMIRRGTESITEEVQKVGRVLDIHLAEDHLIHGNIEGRVSRLEQDSRDERMAKY